MQRTHKKSRFEFLIKKLCIFICLPRKILWLHKNFRFPRIVTLFIYFCWCCCACYFIWCFWSKANLQENIFLIFLCFGFFFGFYSCCYGAHASFQTSQRQRLLFSFVKVMGKCCFSCDGATCVSAENCSKTSYGLYMHHRCYLLEEFISLIRSACSPARAYKAQLSKNFFRFYASNLILWIFMENASVNDIVVFGLDTKMPLKIQITH